ncbi:hypothetical protein A4249_02680 [Brevundimonas sp. GW460-12-10-14-LB2]|jgi:hypothetical protein|uniref:DUF1285 domain-containing protein n=1 Tax=Brevundimonas sp. GW460-12-10-14-LB2 TaxID=1827469 RepID=UPI0007BCB109|nr:DUF1285 domain-containing protein [Brevundimonas sp. GW460-12-10-14-LB2]ANC52667.1 hypothetical protein A4249_02680 [Brevundimonas sp. GW460-12-10-14-LB2]MEA3472427.1 DUF1285 domain-containing protein [Pseudomonadota bacterium]
MDNPKSGLNAVAEAAKQAPGKGLPPVHLWHPEHCGDIDIVIRANGVWMHEGSPIGRKELVRLFSTVLRKDPDGYHLVTPVEKLKITVEDLPFRAVAMRREGDALIFTTDVGDEVRASEDDPIVVETDPTTGEPAPRIHVRRDLWARIARSVFYEMVEMAHEVDGRLVVRSGGQIFSLGAVT